MTPSWYDVLGVDDDATTDEIRAAWQDSIAGLDPTDRRFKQRNRAAEVLLDDRRRAAHDADLAASEDDEPEAEEVDEAPTEEARAAGGTTSTGADGQPTKTAGQAPSARSVAGALAGPGAPPAETRTRLGRGRGARPDEEAASHATARIKALGRTDGPAEDDDAEEPPARTRTARAPRGQRTPAVAAESGEPAEPAKPSESGESGERSGVRWRTAVVASVVALALLVALVLSLALARGDSGSDLPDDRQVAAARKAAESAIGPILSYDYRSLDKSREAAVSFMTPSYAATYEQNFDAIVAENAEQTKTIVTAQVVTSGIVRTGRDRVDVLVFVNRPTRNAQGDDVSRDQVTVRMLDSSGRWLVDCLITEPGGTCG